MDLKLLIAAIISGIRVCRTEQEQWVKSYCFIVGGILRIGSADKLLYSMLSGDGRLIICCNNQTMPSLCGFHCDFTRFFSDLHAECTFFLGVYFWLGLLGVWVLSPWLIPSRLFSWLNMRLSELLNFCFSSRSGRLVCWQRPARLRPSSPPPLSQERDAGDKNVRIRCFFNENAPVSHRIISLPR